MNYRTSFRQLRKISQLVCLLFFLFLFRRTEYTGQDTVSWTVTFFFQLDPLAALSTMLGIFQWSTFFLPAAVIILITLVFGRIFCGWICPMGTLLDIFHRFVPNAGTRQINFRYLKYIILMTVLISSVCKVQWIGFVDPFCLLVRGMTFAVDPLMHTVVSNTFGTVYIHGPAWLSGIIEPLYDFIKTVFLPFSSAYYHLVYFSFLILVIVFLLEFFSQRFWCRNLCPLGAMLALVSRVSFFNRVPVFSCRYCEKCMTACRMEAFNAKAVMMKEECNLCMDCLSYCPDATTSFRFSVPGDRAEIDFSRRQFLASGLLGITLPALAYTDVSGKQNHPDVIRPPGALEENDFMAACIRCGACMKVCIKNGLQPLILEKGVEGMFTPRLVPRVGYCEYNCTLCSQVCPSGALEKLSHEEKHSFVIGKAYFDKNRCLPYAAATPCMVCEEHCPTGEKAILFKQISAVDRQGNTIELKQPYIMEERCIGCGICEHNCPVEGTAAIRVVANSSVEVDRY